MNQIAVVTGVNHDHGIGAATCMELAKKGNDIFFTCWGAEDKWAEKFRHTIRNTGVNAEFVDVDFSQPDAYAHVLNRVENTLGVPSVLINNAAHSTRDSYKKLNVNILDNHYAVNMRTTMMLSVEFARRLEISTLANGRIIHLTSGQSQGPMINELAYGATKGAISAFTLSLSAELAPLGITVNAVNPGPTDTGWMTDEIKKELSSKFKMGRVGQPTDAARLIGFLASKEAEWVTGQVIHSEGGFLRS